MKKIRSAIAVLLAVLLATFCLTACSDNAETPTVQVQEDTFIQPVFTETPATVKKTEVVYVTLDGNGAFRSATVSDWLHTDRPNVRVEDISSLTDIENVKSEILPVFEEGKVIWNMDETDLYYSGTTTEQPPVAISVRYFLNGVEYSAADIAGKSGTVTIKISMKNNKTATIKDSRTGESMFEVSLPVLVAGLAILPEDDFDAITTEGVTCIGDGSKQIAVTLGLPGFSESLGLDTMDFEDLEGLKMTGESSITLTTDNFKLTNMYFVMLPLCSMDIGLVIPESLSTLTSDLNSMSALIEVITSLDFDAMTSVINELAGNFDQLLDLTDVMTEAIAAYEQNKALLDFFNKYLTTENVATLTNLANSVTPETIDSLTQLASNPLVSILLDAKTLTAINALADAAPLLKEMLTAMQNPEVKQALDNLPQTVETMQGVSESIAENEELINSFSTIISSGGMDALTDLLDSLKDTDLSSLVYRYEQLMGNADGLTEKAKYWIQYGESYKIFTDAPENFETSLTFICKTAAIG
ncbi:MAG: hypothetical protein IKJ63_02245 [Clostridia bacterium]|nr:hypothetical protein [Clostridia bacterium]